MYIIIYVGVELLQKKCLLWRIYYDLQRKKMETFSSSLKKQRNTVWYPELNKNKTAEHRQSRKI